jgi:hypothetical protein
MTEPRTTREEGKVQERVPLGSMGGTECTRATRKHPWGLPVDAFTVPAGASVGGDGRLLPTLDGGLAKELGRVIGEARFGTFRGLVDEEARRHRFGPTTAVLVALPEDLEVALGPSYAFVATASGPEASAENAGRAGAAVAQYASRTGIPRIALSLLGSGAARLDSRQVARSLLRAVLSAGSLPALRALAFTTLPPSSFRRDTPPPERWRRTLSC